MHDHHDDRPIDLPEELRHIAARARALMEKCPSVVTFLDNILFMLEDVDITDRMIEEAMITFRFCRQHPDLALTVASFAQLPEHESKVTGDTH